MKIAIVVSLMVIAAAAWLAPVAQSQHTIDLKRVETTGKAKQPVMAKTNCAWFVEAVTEA